MLYIQRSKQSSRSPRRGARPGVLRVRVVGHVVEIHVGELAETIEPVEKPTTASMISSVCSVQSTSSAEDGEEVKQTQPVRATVS